tara:strand:+ start:297 stop:1115 length:819 start_codon:yes stop_codon:yes gene_type:complete
MQTKSLIPQKNYGILKQDKFSNDLDEIAEQVRRIGFAVMDSNIPKKQLEIISKTFNSTFSAYVEKFGKNRLIKTNEINTIRAPLYFEDEIFISLATNKNLLKILAHLIDGKFILNQQNGIINPPCESYNQGSWHRDFPYQHFISDTPLGINALFCIDEFTVENGSTFVLPTSHKVKNFPSQTYIRKNALQVTAKPGQFIILDCMTFHSGGYNYSDKARRAVNHVYTIPYFNQQIDLTKLLKNKKLTPKQKDLFGFNSKNHSSVIEYIDSRRD